MRGAWYLIGLGLTLLLLGVVVSLAGTKSVREPVEGSGIVHSGQIATLDSLIGVPEGYSIVNGTLRLANLGNATALALVGPLDDPAVLSIEPGESVEVYAGPGYSISVHSRGEGVAVISVDFSGWMESGAGTGVVLLSIALFTAGSIASTLGVVVYYLYHMERGKPD